MSNSLSGDRENFRIVFDQIKSYVRNNPDLSYEDREKISELLRVLRYIVQYDILERCFDENAVLTSVVADIDTKLYLVEAEREELRKSANNRNIMKLIALKKTSDDLNRIKKSILDKDFSFYVSEMNAGLLSSEELIAACSAVLSNGKDEYARLFNRDIVTNGEVNRDGINILFTILTNPRIKAKLESFLELEGSFEALRQERDDNIRFLEYLRLAKKHEVILREYLTSMAKVGSTSKDDYLVNKERIATLELQISDMPTQGLSAIFNRKHREQAEDQLNNAKNGVQMFEQITKRNRELGTLLHKFGLGPVIDVYYNASADKTVEDRAATYIKSSMNRHFFSITSAEEKIKARNHELEYLLQSERIYIEKTKTELDPVSYDFIVLNHDDVERILAFMNDKSRNSLNPLLAAYILKALSDAKNLGYEEIMDVCAVNLDVEKMYQDYQKRYDDEARIIQDTLLELEQAEQNAFASFGVGK